MSKRRKEDGRIYSVVRAYGRYYWIVWRPGKLEILAEGRSNSQRGAFYAVRNFMKNNQNEVYQ